MADGHAWRYHRRVMNPHVLYRKLGERFRRRRMAAFAARVGLTPETTVLDVGGSPEIWRYCPVEPRVTFLNCAPLPTVPPASQVVGDGCTLPFTDEAFEVVFSNSVIEHVGDAERRRAFAAELLRVGKRVWIQTPNRWFPVEPHLMSFAVHWLPLNVMRTVAPWISLRILSDGRENFTRDTVLNLWPIGPHEFALLFPNMELEREHVLGFTKSLIAVTPSARIR